MYAWVEIITFDVIGDDGNIFEVESSVNLIHDI